MNRNMNWIFTIKSCCVIGAGIVLIFLGGKFLQNSDMRLAWSIDIAVKSNRSFRGVVLVTKNGRVVYKKSSADEPVEEQQFLVASLAKQLTSALILREVEKGNISLSQSANAYLGSRPKINQAITVHHLLSHTSGIVDGQGLRFKPGTKYEYSNAAYAILGDILRNVTGRKYEDLAFELLREANMYHSFFVDADSLGEVRRKHPQLRLSFLWEQGKWVEVPQPEPRKFYVAGGEKVFFTNPGGGLVSTATDLTLWNYAVHGGKILSDRMYRQMTSKIVKSDFPRGFYGYGLGRPSDYEISHIGYVNGYRSTLSYFPGHGISLVILENVTVGNRKLDFRMHKNIRKMILNYVGAGSFAWMQNPV